MIPPIPPEPPVPTKLEITYETKTDFTLNGTTPAVFYKNLRIDNVPVGVYYEQTGSADALMDDLVLYEVDGVSYCYFALGTASYFTGLLGNNSALETTCQFYTVNSGSVSTGSSYYVSGCTPETYYDDIKNGNFTLSPR